jgi:NADPH:quinone reductase-like Zn-dependent oxidoreductase
MRAILIREPGAEDVLVPGDAPEPPLGPADLRIRVRATAVNRADLLQRLGLYPPPPGASPILGLECAGEVMETGPESRGFARGQRIMALLPGGGYAEQATVHHGSALPVPDGMSDEEAGAFPEVFFTAFSNLYMAGLGALGAGETALVHGGGGGVGTAAIHLLRESGNPCLVTAGSDDKCQRCVALGARAAINYKTEDFRARARELTGGRGVDVVVEVTAFATEPVRDAVDCVTPGGTVVLAGVKGMKPVPDFVSDKVVLKEVTLRGAIGVTYEAYARAIRLIESRRVPLERLQTHRFALEDAERAVRTLAGEFPEERAVHCCLLPRAG